MGKAVKSIVKVAAIAGAAYFGGQALAASWGAGATAAAGTSHLGAAGLATFYGGGTAASAGVGASIFGSGLISKVGAGLQVISYMQQRKALSAQSAAYKQAALEQKKQNEMQERIRLRNERIEKERIIETQRFQEGSLVAGAAGAGLSLTGTSPFLGSVGSVASTSTANLSNLMMASGESTALSQSSQRQADYLTSANIAYGQAQQWSDLGVLGKDMMYKSTDIANIFKIT